MLGQLHTAFCIHLPLTKMQCPSSAPRHREKQWSNIWIWIAWICSMRNKCKIEEIKKKKIVDYTLDISPWLHLIQICLHDVYTWIFIFDSLKDEEHLNTNSQSFNQEEKRNGKARQLCSQISMFGRICPFFGGEYAHCQLVSVTI